MMTHHQMLQALKTLLVVAVNNIVNTDDDGRMVLDEAHDGYQIEWWWKGCLLWWC